MSADDQPPVRPAPPLPSRSPLEERIAHRFADGALLEAALTHGSFLNEHPELGGEDNQRLEFLGDAVVQLAVSQALFCQHPGEPEGQLTKMRAQVVSRPALAAAARRIDLGGTLRLGRGEDRSGGRDKDSLLADAFESLAGALFLDAGFGEASRLLLPMLAQAIDGLELLGDGLLDAKSRLQELIQPRHACTPLYLLVAEQGPEHAKGFVVHVTLGGCVWGVGLGPTKKAAEMAAAAQALLQLERAAAQRGGLPPDLADPPRLTELEEEAKTAT